MVDGQDEHVGTQLNVEQENRSRHRQPGHDQRAPHRPVDSRPEGQKTFRVLPGERRGDDEPHRCRGQHRGRAGGKLSQENHQQQGDERADGLRDCPKVLGHLQLKDRAQQVVELIANPAHSRDQNALQNGRVVVRDRDDRCQKQHGEDGGSDPEGDGVADDSCRVAIGLRDFTEGDRVQTKVERHACEEQQRQYRAVLSQSLGADGACEHAESQDPDQRSSHAPCKCAPDVPQQLRPAWNKGSLDLTASGSAG